ncbi:hypothetical protein G6F31_018382 [Rhizopus arrhizus]|nr:hypothetical protein G6F31_018382 [Rhizopus arrhizus]
MPACLLVDGCRDGLGDGEVHQIAFLELLQTRLQGGVLHLDRAHAALRAFQRDQVGAFVDVPDLGGDRRLAVHGAARLGALGAAVGGGLGHHFGGARTGRAHIDRDGLVIVQPRPR